MKLRKTYLFWGGIVLIIAGIVINNLVHSIMDLEQKKQVVVEAERELQAEQKKNIALKQQLSKVQNPQFIEEEAHDKLLWVKPGEELVILPSPSPMPKVEVTPTPLPVSNLEQWYQLIRH